jgi:hypothetical protein
MGYLPNKLLRMKSLALNGRPTMLPTELIKEMAERVPGWEWNCHGLGIHYPGPAGKFAVDITTIKEYDLWAWEKVYYLLLLSQCCDELGIVVEPIKGTECWYWEDEFNPFPTPTAAREAALEFVLGGISKEV